MPKTKKLKAPLAVVITLIALYSIYEGYSRITGINNTPTHGTTSKADDTRIPATTPAPTVLTICSFNIQFLGNFKGRDNESLADILKPYDIVVIQELVAPPYPMNFPDGTPVKPDDEAKKFFDAMAKGGFRYKLSEEDTGTGAKIHLNSTSTEWWVTFYKPDKVQYADDLPTGFLADDRSDNPDYERVPYAFGFRTLDKKLDFVLISVHLQPGDGSADKTRRKHELSSIESWINAHNTIEKDFIMLGDMNMTGAQELADVIPQGYLSLNDECVSTNTNPNGPKPYDQIMYNTTYTTEIDKTFDMKVVNLIDAMKGHWTSSAPYPGDPYNHDEFRQHYSDHNPVVFEVDVGEKDDD